MVLKNFIVFEGIDGSGTTTQIRMLKEKCTNISDRFVFTAEPTSRETGLFLRSCLSGKVKVHPKTMVRLFAADRCEHLYGYDGILSNLNDGRAICTDRYLFSSLAYQSAENARNAVRKANEDFPLPEFLFFFKIEPVEAFKRIDKRGSKKEIYEKLEFQEMVHNEYIRIMKDYTSTEPDMHIIQIDAMQDITKIHEKIWSILKNLPIV